MLVKIWLLGYEARIILLISIDCSRNQASILFADALCSLLNEAFCGAKCTASDDWMMATMMIMK